MTIPAGAFVNPAGLANAAAASSSVSFLPPTASLTGPAAGVVNQPLTFNCGAGDVSAEEQGGAFSYTVNWGDGSAGSPDTQTAVGAGGGLALNHVYARPGSYTVQLWATDKDGTSSQPVTQTVTVSNVVQVGSTLFVGGNGTISVTPGLDVAINGQQFGPYAGVSMINVYGGSGNDVISIDKAVTTPAAVYGGGGNDTMQAGGGYDTLVGGNGNDTFIDGGGINVMVGGNGSNTFIDNGGFNQLYGGSGTNLVVRAGGAAETFLSLNELPALTVLAKSATRAYG
ncbi:MAG TPA: PKD domain-containing protein [Gemmataceae bacterium]|nr:PKD domain-containing protein [Gemmataceae bacterium]